MFIECKIDGCDELAIINTNFIKRADKAKTGIFIYWQDGTFDTIVCKDNDHMDAILRAIVRGG